ncbi:MAG: glycosyltransferase [Chitinophagales bacterium]|nr:glycosyltransferase [Chitinophagales bacterium]
MIKNRDIIIVGLQPWDIPIGSNCRNIAIEFAKHNRVLYVNSPLDSNTKISQKKNPLVAKRLELLKEKENNLKQVSDNLWNLYPANTIRSINWIPSTGVFRKFNRINNVRFATDIKEAAKKLNFRDYILFNDSDMFRSYHLKELLNPAITIYYSRDNLMVFKYWFKHGHKLEPELIKKSSLVVANSQHLTNIAQKYNPNSFYVGQGCDLSMFDPTEDYNVPDDIKNIRRPVIGYIGTIFSSRLDVELLTKISEKKPDWSFVFVGQTDEVFSKASIQYLPNVHFLGHKDGSLLPDYLKQFDVAINPQPVNEYTIGNYPRKVDEYLAMGKPVVATKTDTMSIFREVVYLGITPEDYIHLIEKALKEDNKELQKKRIEVAATHTWERSVQAIYEAIIKVDPSFASKQSLKTMVS